MKSPYNTNELRELFRKNFKEKYIEWKSKDKKRTQEDFANEVRALYERNHPEDKKERKIDGKLVSKYCSTGTIPTLYLDEVAEVLGVNRSYFFTPKGHDEQYRFSRSFVTDFGKQLSKYSSDIGLDLSFLYAIKNISNFEKDFPLYSPMVCKPDLTDFFDINYRYTRADFAESAKMNEPENIFQIEKDGKIINMSKADLEYLKTVQDKVCGYIGALFDARKNEMAEEEHQAAKASIKTDKNGVSICGPLTYNGELGSIDKYYKFLEKNNQDTNRTTNKETK